MHTSSSLRGSFARGRLRGPSGPGGGFTVRGRRLLIGGGSGIS